MVDQGFVAFVRRIWGSALPTQLMRAILVAALFELLVFAVSGWLRKLLGRALARDAHADPALRLERRRIVLGVPLLLVRAVLYCLALLIILRIFRFRAEQDLYPVALALLVLVAVGARQVLRDAFAGYVIHYDYLYAIGDEITIGERSGVVSHLTLRQTCLLGRDGTEVWIPNSEVRTVLNQSDRKRRSQEAQD
jgi:small-conductance mechanosensitive channel